jgi:hypothetical protein
MIPRRAFFFDRSTSGWSERRACVRPNHACPMRQYAKMRPSGLKGDHWRSYALRQDLWFPYLQVWKPRVNMT